MSRTTLEMYQQREWVAVRADEVRSGDILANHATVTASRRWRKGDFFEPDKFDKPWIIRCGKDFATGGDAGRAVVIGRRKPRSP